MKKLSVILALVALFVTSCSDDIGVSEPIAGKPTIPVEISNEIVQVTSTRINDAGFCDGDAVGVYVVNYENDAPGVLHSKGNQVDNMKFTYDEANNKWVPMSEVYYRDEMTLVDIVGYYPYASPSNVIAYAFEVAKDQSSDAANGELGGYEASDFLWGKADKVSPTAGRANIKFHHRMAGVLVELSEGTGFADGEWVEVEKEVLVSNVKRNAIINLATGEVKATGEVPNTATVPYKSETSYRAIVVPQTIAASTALFNITVDGTSYIYRKNEAFTYTSGKLHKFTIEVSKKSQSGLEFKLLGESITAWEDENITHDGMAREYVIIHVPKASTDGSSALRTAIEAEGKDFSKIKNLKVTGEINARDFDFMREEMILLNAVNLNNAEVKEKEIPDYSFCPEYTDNGKESLMFFVFPKNIQRIGKQAFRKTRLSGSLQLPNCVTIVDDYAFSGIYSFGGGRLILPDSLVEVGESAFGECGFIGNLQLPKTLKKIGHGAFGGNSFVG
ncbi:MAG: fimbrillin family protein, partial [Bacteroidaceae bacterium]|nr:fimbrillin family protein [Bacteroidaceae bacterium]